MTSFIQGVERTRSDYSFSEGLIAAVNDGITFSHSVPNLYKGSANTVTFTVGVPDLNEDFSSEF